LVCLKTRRNLVALSYFFWDRWITTQRNISTKSGEGVFLFENIQASESLRVGIFLIDVPFFWQQDIDKSSKVLKCFYLSLVNVAVICPRNI